MPFPTYLIYPSTLKATDPVATLRHTAHNSLQRMITMNGISDAYVLPYIFSKEMHFYVIIDLKKCCLQVQEQVMSWIISLFISYEPTPTDIYT